MTELYYDSEIKELYTQCTLARYSESLIIQLVSYLPKKFAILNNFVLLKDKDDWIKWKIIGIGNSLEERPNINQIIKEHRIKTGDSLPKRSVEK